MKQIILQSFKEIYLENKDLFTYIEKRLPMSSLVWMTGSAIRKKIISNYHQIDLGTGNLDVYITNIKPSDLQMILPSNFNINLDYATSENQKVTFYAPSVQTVKQIRDSFSVDYCAIFYEPFLESLYEYRNEFSDCIKSKKIDYIKLIEPSKSSYIELANLSCLIQESSFDIGECLAEAVCKYASYDDSYYKAVEFLENKGVANGANFINRAIFLAQNIWKHPEMKI